MHADDNIGFKPLNLNLFAKKLQENEMTVNVCNV